MNFNELNYEHAVQNLTTAIYWLTTARFATRHNMLESSENSFKACKERINEAIKLIQEFQDETKPF